MSETVRTAPVTSITRRRAARSAFFRSSRVIRITSGQRKAILGRFNGQVDGGANGEVGAT